MKINLGSGQDYRLGWENIDRSEEVKADIYLDIQSEKLPFGDGTVEEIYCSGLLEQILRNEDLVFVLNECYRVLQIGAKMTVVIPNSKYSITFRDPFDCRHFLPETFDYLEQGNELYEKYGLTYGFLPWNIKKRETNQRGIMTVILEKSVL